MAAILCLPILSPEQNESARHAPMCPTGGALRFSSRADGNEAAYQKKSIYCFLIIYFLIFQGLFDHFYVTRLKKRQSLAAFMVQVFPEMALAMWICALSPLVTAT